MTVLFALLFLASLIGNLFLFLEVDAYKANPQKAASDELQMIVERVGKLVALPMDETPTVATVNDPEKLVDQPFFAQAKKGDKVLIYTTAKKAILFDPVGGKIIEIAPLNIGENN